MQMSYRQGPASTIAVTHAGQGVNTALEDAAVLARHLQDGGLCEESLRSFERERIPRVSTIATQEQVTH